MRRTLGILAALGLAHVSAFAQQAGVGWSDAFAGAFTRGDRTAGALFRYWLPGGFAEPEQVAREIDAIADAGYKGVEIAHVMAGADYPVDPDRYGYGTDRWQRVVEAVLEAAARRGLQVDLTLGARWPIAIPGLDVDGPAAARELAFGHARVQPGEVFDGPVPRPAPHTYEDRTSVDGAIRTEVRTAEPRFVTAVAMRCRADCASQPFEVELESAVVLGSQAGAAERLAWTAPGDGTWLVVGYWSRGTGQRHYAPFDTLPYLLTDPEGRVVDHFDRVGTEAFLEYFGGLLGDDTRRLLRETGGAFFEDSLELSGLHVWTPRFLERFEEKRGYSLAPYLAAVARLPRPQRFSAPPPAFAFGDEEAAVAERVRHDAEQTLNDLYLEEHVEPIRRWAASLGLAYRAQPYGEPIDLGLASAVVDIPECESLGCRTMDDWRVMASGADMGGRGILSSEMIPGRFRTPFESTRADLVRLVNREYAMGANQMVFHGFPYAHWPESADGSVVDSSARWPGFHAFPAYIPETFGPRQPEWAMEARVAAYWARSQLVLQHGARRTDVAVYTQIKGHVGEPYPSESLLARGYTYGYVTPGSLTLPAARVEGGRLSPAAPAFRALVLHEQESLPPATARRLLRLARDGLPVLVVGDPPRRAAGYGASAAVASAADADLRRVVASLLDEPGVSRVADAAGVPDALAALGVDPAATAEGAPIRSVRRVAADVDLYWLYNPEGDAAEAVVSLSGRSGGVPYALDPWTGRISRVARYEVDGGRYRIPMAFAAGEGKTIAIRSAPAGARVHVVATTADSAHFGEAGLAVRAAADGSVAATLSDGRRVDLRASGVPGPIALPRWDLVVDEHRPGGEGAPSSRSDHREWRFEDLELVPWSQIPEIGDAVGIGRYAATVELPASWTSAHGAHLELGAVRGTFRVAVNGTDVGPVNLLAGRVDVGAHLVAGANRIEIEVATTLLNRLRVLRPDEYGEQEKLDYGLLGPVVLRPYLDVAVADGDDATSGATSTR